MKSKLPAILKTIGFGIGIFFAGFSLFAQNSPHAVWGTVRNSSNQPPKSEGFAFYAYVSTRPNEILTVQSVGSGYHEPDGTWWLNTGNFATEWRIGDILVVELISTQAPTGVERKVISGVLTSAGNDNFGRAALESLQQAPQNATPVEWLRFSARMIQKGHIELIWQTASETNNSGFTVERALGDADAFTAIAFVKGAGTTSTEQKYGFKDFPPQALRYRYRLRQVDFNGKTTYSDIVEVANFNPESFRLQQNYPNPFRMENGLQTQISFSLREAGHARLTVYDVLGRTVKQLLNQRLQAGYHKVTWNGYNNQENLVPAGLYFYELQLGKQKLRKSLLLIR